MKTLLIAAVALIAISTSGCNGNNNSSRDNSKITGASVAQAPATATEIRNSSTPLGAVTAAYLQIKDGLANDNANDAAAGGKAFGDALAKVDKAAMSPEQKKSFEDIADDAKEMAEHISTNGDRIAHQREHFDMLSKDMYDLVKSLGAAQPLYQEFCPMYNNKKGASWLSETKDIKNPYMGKKMATCGTLKEEIKQKS